MRFCRDRTETCEPSQLASEFYCRHSTSPYRCSNKHPYRSHRSACCDLKLVFNLYANDIVVRAHQTMLPATQEEPLMGPVSECESKFVADSSTAWPPASFSHHIHYPKTR